MPPEQVNRKNTPSPIVNRRTSKSNPNSIFLSSYNVETPKRSLSPRNTKIEIRIESPSDNDKNQSASTDKKGCRPNHQRPTTYNLAPPSHIHDRELIRRQQALIALQPRTQAEILETRRELIRLRTQRRKEKNTQVSSTAKPSIKEVANNQTVRSRGPSPGRLNGDEHEFDSRKQLAESSFQATKLGKKALKNSDKSLTPKITRL